MRAWAHSPGAKVWVSRRFSPPHPPSQPIFCPVSTKHTHIHTLRQPTFWPQTPPGKQRSMLGGAEDGGQTRADRGPGASTPPRTGRPGLALTSQYVRQGGKSASPAPEAQQGIPRGALRMAGVSKRSPGSAHPWAWDLSLPPPQDGSRTLFTPRLRGHRGAGPAARGGGRARTRVRTGRPRRAAPRRDPLRSHARCARRAGAGRPPWAPHRQAPGAAAASPGPAPGPGSGGD